MKGEKLDESIKKWFFLTLTLIVIFFLAGFVWPNYDVRSIVFRVGAAIAGTYGFLRSFEDKKVKKENEKIIKKPK